MSTSTLPSSSRLTSSWLEAHRISRQPGPYVRPPDSADRMYTNAEIDAMTQVERARECMAWQQEENDRLTQQILTAQPQLPPELDPFHRWKLGSYDRPQFTDRPSLQSEIAGRAIAFDQISRPNSDGWRIVVRPAALNDLSRHAIPLLVSHDSQYELDDSVKWSIDRQGLNVESHKGSYCNPSLYRSVLALIQDGTLCGLSVRLPPVSECDVTEYPGAKVREFHRIPYFTEISLAGNPIMPGTFVRGTRPHTHRLRPDGYFHSQLLDALGSY